MDAEHNEREPETEKETSGEYLFRVLRPAGCIFVLLCMVMYFIVCFTHRGTPAAAQAAPSAAVTVTETAAPG